VGCEVRGTNALGWPRPTTGRDLALSSNWAVAWCLPEVLASGPLVELRVPPPCSVTTTEGEYGSRCGGDDP